VPEGANNLPISIPVATQALHAVGLGYAIKYRRKDDVALVFLGDGATSEGDFHEAINFAGVFQPRRSLSVRTTNGISAAAETDPFRDAGAKGVGRRARHPGGRQRPAGNLHGAREAIDRARSGGGPTMIEM
jgi:pyruvate dehydrogenase E1 component alpha subunit